MVVERLVLMPSQDLVLRKTDDLILFVEDEGLLRCCVNDFLQKCGFSLLTAEAGEQALELASQNRIRLLISDINLPGMSGESVFQILSKSNPGLKAIFTSGFLEGERSVHSGFGDSVIYLQKPFGLATLANVIHSILSRQ